MSNDVQAGLVDPKNTIEIIKIKVEMILLAVMTQTLSMIEGYDEQLEKTAEDNVAHARAKLNFGYLTDIAIPYALRMDFIDGIELSAAKSQQMYYTLSTKVQKLENRVVTSYNSEPNVKAMLDWSSVENKFVINATAARLSKKPKHWGYIKPGLPSFLLRTHLRVDLSNI